MRQQLGPIYPTYATFCSFHFCWLESQTYWMSSWSIFKAVWCFQLNLLLIKLTFYLKSIILHKHYYQMHNLRITLDIVVFFFNLRLSVVLLQKQTSASSIISISWWKWIISNTAIDSGFYQNYSEILFSVPENVCLCCSNGGCKERKVWRPLFWLAYSELKWNLWS